MTKRLIPDTLKSIFKEYFSGPITAKRFVLVTLFSSALMHTAHAEIPTVLTDAIYKGEGVIDLFKDVSSSELQQVLQSGTLRLGVDLNESSDGNENRDSVGVAIRSLELVVSTANGDVSFSEFYTNTSAMITESGASSASSYNTLFGTNGSNNITGSTSGFDLSQFDDVIEVRNLSATGEILGAELRISFLDTASGGENEAFFDYSAGFEDFAILTAEDASILDSAAIGINSATPSTVSYTHEFTAPSGAPQPLWFVLILVPLFARLKKPESNSNAP